MLALASCASPTSVEGSGALKARLVHVLSVVDTRSLVAAPGKLDARAVGQAFLWLTVSLAAYRALPLASPQGEVLLWVLRWVCALVIVYAGVSAGYLLAHVAYAAAGFSTPVLHASPALSRSVQELWGQRWARPVSMWLTETFMRPYARKRRAVTGVLLAFAASGALHAYSVWVALGFLNGLAMAAWMLAYFVTQAGVVALERVLGVRRWRPWAGHTWTVVWMLSTSPLFLEPLVRVLGARS